MGKAKSNAEVAVISDDSRLCERTVALLERVGRQAHQYDSIDAFRSSDRQTYAVIFAANSMSYDTQHDLQFLGHFERLIVISKTLQEQDIVTSLYNGAHFYFDITESDSLLSVRLQSALRTHGEKVLPNIVAPPYNFDVQRRRVFLNNRQIALSPMEYKFAEYLFSRPDEVVAKSELMLSVWTLPRLLSARRVDTAASRVRKKMYLGSDQSGWELQNVRNVGFKISAMHCNFEVA